MSRLMETNGLSVVIGNQVICQDFSMTLEPGDRLGVLGANGAGKTTLLHTLAGLRQPDAGVINLKGKPLHSYDARHRARELGVLFQDHHEPLFASVLESALCGRHPYHSALETENEEDFAIARKALADTGMSHKLLQPVHQLSGGEKKRLDLATLLVQDPSLYLLDEPNSHLDVHFQIRLLKLVSEKVTKNAGGAIMVLHDVNLAQRFCNRILMLFDDGTHILGTTSEVLNTTHLNRLFVHPMGEISDGDYKVFYPE